MARSMNPKKSANPGSPGAESWSASASTAPPVGIRQLRADVAAYVRRAGAGESLVINVGGRPTAQLGPLSAPDGLIRLDDLVARGALVPPRRTGAWHMTAPITVWSGNRLDRLLREIR